MIGFYIKPNGGAVNKTQKIKEDKITRKNNNKNKILTKEVIGYFKIIIIALIFTFLGVNIGKKIYFKRKKRANELLDDNYQYDYNNKEEVKDNKNNKSFTSIEMNIKLGIK